MSFEVKIPQVGESITEVTISTWNVASGDSVSMNDVLCEIESDKASFELPAEQDGTIEILVEEGETVEIGTVVAKISESGSSSSSTESKEAPKEEKAAPAPSSGGGESKTVEIKIPAVGESITEVTISSWSAEDGDQVEANQVLCEIESDKASFELPSDATGTLEIVAQEGDTLEIGALVAKIHTSGSVAASTASNSPAPASESTSSTPSGDGSGEGIASPAAAKILREKGIDPKDVEGTGKDGRITKADAENAQKPTPKKEAPKQESKPAPKQEVAAPSGNRETTRKKMTPLRKTIAKRLVAAKNETAMLTTFNEVNMQPMMDLRKKYKELFKEKHEIGLGFMSFFTKAATMALQEFPAVNAQIDGEEMLFNDFVDVSIAVSSPRGLVVPVIRDTQNMNFADIEKEVVRLAIKARDGKLSIPEMTGGTFTITNGGIFGSMLSTPIINAPQSAILGMHNIVQRPIAVNGEVKIAPIMYVALSYDHRVIDGKESVSFLYRIKELIEDPGRMLLEV